MTITSKFHLLNAVITPILFVVPLLGLSYMVAILSFLDLSNGKVDSIFKTPIYVAIALLVLVFFLVWFYLKTLKKIQLNNQGIRLITLFNSEFIPWSEVEKIELTGKSQIMMSPMESTSLFLKTGTKKHIVAAYYRNMPSLRIFLAQANNFLNANKPIELKPVLLNQKLESIRPLNLNLMNKYSGNHFLSVNGIMIYGWIGFLSFLLITGITVLNTSFGLLIYAATMLFFYGCFGFQLHYFYLDKEYLVIKNHVWPWRQIVFRLADIKEVVFEIPNRKSISLRVITNNYESKLYPAGSLRYKTWEKLKKDFSSKKIKVRNEAF
jgi:hypothetical protein